MKQLRNLILLVLIVFALFFSSCGKDPEPEKTDEKTEEKTSEKPVVKKPTFAEKRAKFSTNLVEKRKAPGEFKKETPPDGVSEVKYQSGTLSLKAWLAKPTEKVFIKPSL